VIEARLVFTRPAALPPYQPVDLAGLWSLVVAQPVYDVLRRNGEFFVAHRASPIDVLLLTAALSVALPAILVIIVGAVARASTAAGRILHLALVGTLVGVFTSQVLAALSSVGLATHVTAAVAGAVLSVWTYARVPPARMVASSLALLVPISAGAFLLHPDMAPFVRPVDASRDAAAAIPPGAPPVVIVVFDQLPLSSLMLPDGTVDGRRYPGFGALAQTSTWFRNATANAELTGFAVPALLSGALPRRTRLPLAAHHPQTVFTVLGGTYRMQVTEPITQLCPERLCPTPVERRAERLTAMALDAVVVFLHVVAPRELRATLPSLANNWKDFLQAEHWQRRWVHARIADRREPAMRFIAAIDASHSQPTLYYLHALLPHEPYIYTRTGQQFTSDTWLPGLNRLDRWTSEAWPVLQAYQRHLLQVEYADAVLQRLLHRLQAEGLFDRSLVVITADHGASFRPGRPFRGLDRLTAADIIGVPLFIKTPEQRSGRIDDRNVQAIDLLPTLASTLGVHLRFPVDGTAAIDGSTFPARKVIRHLGAVRELDFDADRLARARMESVARRWHLFEGSVSPVPDGAPRGLLGQPVPASVGDAVHTPIRVLLRDPQRLRNVDLSAPVLPLNLEGRVEDRDGRPAASTLAIAVGGRIRAITRTLDRLAPGTWSAQLEPGALRAGANDITIFLVSPEGQLQLAYAGGPPPATLDLASDTAARFWSVRQTGLSPPQDAPVPFRWSGREATIVAPLEDARPPRSLRVGIAGPPPSRARVALLVNDCSLYDGPVESTPWYRTFSLARCAALLTTEARIVIRATGGTAGGPPGVALETVNLFPAPWPPPQARPLDLRAAVRVVGGAHERVAHTDPLVVDLKNRGAIAWADASVDGDPTGNAALELHWRRLPSGVEDRTQRLKLPRVLHPGDEVRLEVPLVPPLSVGGASEWDVAVVPVMTGGAQMLLDAPCIVRVLANVADRVQ
jgi:arylsulfatase A-like enzyme